MLFDGRASSVAVCVWHGSGTRGRHALRLQCYCLSDINHFARSHGHISRDLFISADVFTTLALPRLIPTERLLRSFHHVARQRRGAVLTTIDLVQLVEDRLAEVLEGIVSLGLHRSACSDASSRDTLRRNRVGGGETDTEHVGRGEQARRSSLRLPVGLGAGNTIIGKRALQLLGPLVLIHNPIDLVFVERGRYGRKRGTGPFSGIRREARVVRIHVGHRLSLLGRRGIHASMHISHLTCRIITSCSTCELGAAQAVITDEAKRLVKGGSFKQCMRSNMSMWTGSRPVATTKDLFHLP